MSGPSSEPAYLDEAGTVSFRDAGHFESEIDVNVLHGRALLRTRSSLSLNQTLALRLKAPNDVGEEVVSGRVVFVQTDLVGIQLTNLDDAKKKSLRDLVRWARDPASRPAPEPPAAPTVPSVEGDPRPTGTVDVRAAHDQAPSADLGETPPVGPPGPTREPTPSPLTEGSGLRSESAEGGSEGATERWPRLESDGRVILRDEAVALALYLLALRCGRIAIDTDPGVDLPDAATFQLDDRVRRVPLRPARAGDGLGVFEIDDPLPLAELVENAGPSLAPMLRGVGLCAPDDLPSGEDGGFQTAGLSPPRKPEPTPPRLEGDVVVFADPSDLARELEANVKNGGLFVESPPLPLRERKDLRFRVGSRDLAPTLTADVVFADAGRVGFSFVDSASAHERLEAARREPGGPTSTGDVPTLDARAGGTTTLDIRIGTDDVVPPFSGQLAPSLDAAGQVDLQRRRIHDPSDLARTSVLQIFEYVVRSGWTGVLHLQSNEGAERHIHFYRGDVAFISAQPFEEHTSLGRILVAQRKVNETQLREALDRSKGSHRLLGRMLVLLGVIKRRELTSALREQTRAKMDSAFDWSEGRYAWGPWVEPPGEADLVVTKGLSVLERHLRTQLDALAYGELEALLEPSLGRVVVPTEMDTLATSLRLSPRELRFIELQLDGTRSIHDAVTGSPLGRLGSLRLVAIGLALGVLRLEGEGEGVAVSGAKPESRGQRQRHAVEELREKLERRLREIRSSSHFDTLRVHWSSHHREYRKAWEQVRNEIDLKSPPLADAPDDVQKLAKEIIRAIDAARDTLENREQRIAYRKKLFDKTERQYAAEMLLKQGEVALLRGDRAAALEALETAAELSPSSKIVELLNTARERR